MIALWVKVRVKPEGRERFLKAIEAHRAAPHYAVWRAAADTLDGPPQATRCDTVFPAAAEYWSRGKR